MERIFIYFYQYFGNRSVTNCYKRYRAIIIEGDEERKGWKVIAVGTRSFLLTRLFVSLILNFLRSGAAWKYRGISWTLLSLLGAEGLTARCRNELFLDFIWDYWDIWQVKYRGITKPIPRFFLSNCTDELRSFVRLKLKWTDKLCIFISKLKLKLLKFSND